MLQYQALACFVARDGFVLGPASYQGTASAAVLPDRSG